MSAVPPPPPPPRDDAGGKDDEGPSDRRGKRPIVDRTPPPSPPSSGCGECVAFDLNVALTEAAGAVAARMLQKALEEGRDEAINCPDPDCGRVFRKWKSLYGHMRCHPGRKWRGIKRLLAEMGPVTESEAADSLMRLKEAENGDGKKPQESGGRRASHKSAKGFYAKGKEKVEVGIRRRDYKCSVCGREFVTPQGLGSHRRVHSKGKAKEKKKKNKRKLDLNKPALPEDGSSNGDSSPSIDLNK